MTTLPTPATLDELDRLDAAAKRATGGERWGLSSEYLLAVGRESASLRSAARMLVELWALLPKCGCDWEACSRPATQRYCGDVRCDAHGPTVREGSPWTSFPWADLVRRAEQ